MRTRIIVGAGCALFALLTLATAAWAHGDVPPDVCVGPNGVIGATWGRYVPHGEQVQTGSPVPLGHQGLPLLGVGGDGWDRPIGQIPPCVPASTTTTSAASTTTSSVATTSTTAARVASTSTTVAARRPAATVAPTTTSFDIGTHAPSYGPGELPKTGGGSGGLAVAGAALVALGLAIAGGARRCLTRTL